MWAFCRSLARNEGSVSGREPECVSIAHLISDRLQIRPQRLLDRRPEAGRAADPANKQEETPQRELTRVADSIERLRRREPLRMRVHKQPDPAIVGQTTNP